MPTRSVNLTERYDAFIEQEIREGRFQDASEALGRQPRYMSLGVQHVEHPQNGFHLGIRPIGMVLRGRCQDEPNPGRPRDRALRRLRQFCIGCQTLQHVP